MRKISALKGERNKGTKDRLLGKAQTSEDSFLKQLAPVYG
jgi:hypothetical protein